MTNSLSPSASFDLTVSQPPTFTKSELLALMRQDLMEEVQAAIMPQVMEQIEKEKQAGLVVIKELQEKTYKCDAKIERQEFALGIYKKEVKALNQEISSMAHKSVEKEEAELEKDKKIALLEKRLAEMELERANMHLDDLDKRAKHARDMALVKASIITLMTAGLGVHTLIEEGCQEAEIRSNLPSKRYHEAVKDLESRKKPLTKYEFLSSESDRKEVDNSISIGCYDVDITSNIS